MQLNALKEFDYSFNPKLHGGFGGGVPVHLLTAVFFLILDLFNLFVADAPVETKIQKI